MDKNIKKKIRYLLNLGDSPNIHESKQAIKKAHELMIKYNFLESEIGKDQEYINKTILFIKCKRFTNKEIIFIKSILEDHFFVSVYLNRNYSHKNNMIGLEVCMYGKESNVEIAEYLYIYLDKEYKRLYETNNKVMKITYKRSINRASFYNGINIELHKRLNENKNNFTEEHGIVISKDHNCIEFNKTLEVTHYNFMKNKAVDIQLGKMESKNINLNRPLCNEKTLYI